jgi:DNA-binding phage protein
VALTRSFRDTVKARLGREPAFRQALLAEAVNTLIEGDLETGKDVLRDFVNGTVGFRELAEETGTPAKSLMRMLGPRGNPTASNLLAIVGALQRRSGITLQVRAA